MKVAFATSSFYHPFSSHSTKYCPRKGNLTTATATTTSACSGVAESKRYDAIVIGAGLGGLCTAALLTAYGRSVAVLEAHSAVGGAAHHFHRRVKDGTVRFESGPHLFSGLTAPSENPLRYLLAATDVTVPVTSYTEWGVFVRDDLTATSVRAGEPFLQQLLERHATTDAPRQVKHLLDDMSDPGILATGLPPALLRAGDLIGSLRVALPHAWRRKLWTKLGRSLQLLQPFQTALDCRVTDEFANSFFNVLCFLLAGTDATRVPVAMMAFMLKEWSPSPEDGVAVGTPMLQHPVGGASQIAEALAERVRRDERSVVRTNARVEKVIVEDGVAKGVVLRSGEAIKADHVISNAAAQTVWDLVPEEFLEEAGVKREKMEDREMCDSFLHLNLAIRMTDEVRAMMGGRELLPNYLSVEDWDFGVEHADNLVLISVPSVVDKSVCPEGYAVLHAYTPATEAYGKWAGLREGTSAYERYKEERGAVLWRAVGKVFGGDVQELAEVKLIGTPKTHARFLRRGRGSYGPKVDARLPLLGLSMPNVEGLPRGMLCVGDGVFPGVGVPAVAGSAWLVANSVVSVAEQRRLLCKVGLAS